MDSSQSWRVGCLRILCDSPSVPLGLSTSSRVLPPSFDEKLTLPSPHRSTFFWSWSLTITSLTLARRSCSAPNLSSTSLAILWNWSSMVWPWSCDQYTCRASAVPAFVTPVVMAQTHSSSLPVHAKLWSSEFSVVCRHEVQVPSGSAHV
jgi:hypothetical protein